MWVSTRGRRRALGNFFELARAARFLRHRGEPSEPHARSRCGQHSTSERDSARSRGADCASSLAQLRFTAIGRHVYLAREMRSRREKKRRERTRLRLTCDVSASHSEA